MARRCHVCGEAAVARGAGGVRACGEHLAVLASKRPIWLRLPDPDDEPVSLDELVASGALSPEGAELTRDMIAGLQQWAQDGPPVDLAALAAEAGDMAALVTDDAIERLLRGEGG